MTNNKMTTSQDPKDYINQRNEPTIREKIQAILDDETVSTYAIAKEVGVDVSAVQRLRKHEFKMENLRLKSVEGYLAYYDRKYSKISK